MNPRDVKYFTVTGYGVQDIEECEYEYAKFIEVEDFDALTLDLAYSENALYDAKRELKELRDGLNDPATLHAHILRTLNHAQIMHIVGDDVAAELTTALRERDEAREWHATALNEMAAVERENASLHSQMLQCPNCKEKVSSSEAPHA